MPAPLPETLQEWKERAIWHICRANEILNGDEEPDAVANGAHASAHARTADTIAHLIDSKIIK